MKEQASRLEDDLGDGGMGAGDGFMDTEIGRIPVEWEVSKLGNVCVQPKGVQTGTFGSQLHQKDYKHFRTPIITIEHLGENRIIHRDLFRSIIIVVPTAGILIHLDRTVGHLFERILANEQESRSLTAIRDVFLTKLMSGEIRVNQ